jgi:hypothetical protein
VYSRPARGSSAGGGYSTAADLLKFTAAVKANKLIAAGNPLAWEQGMGVAGGAEGTNALVVTEGPYTIIVLANYDPPSAEAAGKIIRQWIPR